MRLQEGPLFIWWPGLFNLLESVSPIHAPTRPPTHFFFLFFPRSFIPLKNPGQLPYKILHILDLVHCFLEVWLECPSVHFLLTLSKKIFTPKYSIETTFAKMTNNKVLTLWRTVSFRLCEPPIFPEMLLSLGFQVITLWLYSCLTGHPFPGSMAGSSPPGSGHQSPGAQASDLFLPHIPGDLIQAPDSKHHL